MCVGSAGQPPPEDFVDFLVGKPPRPRPWQPPPPLAWHLRHPHWFALVMALVVAMLVALAIVALP